MGKMNFSVDKNKGKEIIAEELDETEDEDYELEDTSSSNNSSSSNKDEEGKAKLIKMMLIAIVVVVVGIVLLMFVSSLGGGNKTYEEIEEIMSSAAESYFNDHQENLPKKDGGSQTVDVSVLVAEGKMKDLSEYTDALCTGTVKVQKTGSSYAYIPKLNCGESYSSEELYKVIRNDNQVVSSGYGLYNKDGNYVFRGEEVNNYVQLDSALWRVVKINSSNNVVLVMAEPLSTLVPWDDRFNQEVNYNAGINNYSSSRIKEKLDELYNTSAEDVTSVLLSDKDKARIVPYNLCTGKRALTESGAEQAVECREVTREQKLGLLTAADFMNASIDANCTTPTSLTCQNYNYLIDDNSWWLATAVTNTSSDTYMVAANSGLEAKKSMMYARIRPVIYLNSEVMYKSGSGTEEDPYIVK